MDECMEYRLAGLASVEPEVAAMSANDPHQSIRVEAARRMVERCSGFENQPISADEVEALTKKAADGGNPGARARQLFASVLRDKRSGSAELSAARQAEFCAVLRGAQSDPNALIELAPVPLIAATAKMNAALVSAGLNEPASRRLLRTAMEVAACDLGADCGSDSLRALQVCAYVGRCGAPDPVGYLVFDVAATPRDELAFINQWRHSIVQAVESGQCSLLN